MLDGCCPSRNFAFFLVQVRAAVGYVKWKSFHCDMGWREEMIAETFDTPFPPDHIGKLSFTQAFLIIPTKMAPLEGPIIQPVLFPRLFNFFPHSPQAQML